jgi:hypothetical protein
MGAGWAGTLLSWRWEGSVWRAEVSRARYFVRADRHKVFAWAEVRDVGGRCRVEIGTFATVAAAQVACERDAAVRCRGESEERGPVSVAIGRVRRGRARDGVPAVEERPAGEALDAALAAFAEVVGED